MGDHKSHIVHVEGPYIYEGVPYNTYSIYSKGDHRSHIRNEDTLHVGDHMYMWGIIQYLYHIR